MSKRIIRRRNPVTGRLVSTRLMKLPDVSLMSDPNFRPLKSTSTDPFSTAQNNLGATGDPSLPPDLIEMIKKVKNEKAGTMDPIPTPSAAAKDILTAKGSAAGKVGRPTKTDKIKATLPELEKYFKDMLEQQQRDALAEFQNQADTIRDEILQNQTITINTPMGSVNLTGLTHNRFVDLLKALHTQFSLMLVGPAGSGKTFACEKAAEVLNTNFYAISVGAQTSQTAFLGYMNAVGGYVGTAFRTAYEEGGLFLVDEIDAGNPNVLIVLNSALSNDMCSFPDKMVRRHENFRFVATANTFGTGGNRHYVGRNQLDAATLDRFIMLEWPIDEHLESMLVAAYPEGPQWDRVVKAVRRVNETRDYRQMITPRATLKGAQLLQQGFDFEEVVRMTLIANAPVDPANTMMTEAKRAWSYNS